MSLLLLLLRVVSAVRAKEGHSKSLNYSHLFALGVDGGQAATAALDWMVSWDEGTLAAGGRSFA